MNRGGSARTLEDLDRTIRAIAVHFDTDLVIIVGSQAVLLGWPDAPVLLRTSGEIDAYPGNSRDWEAQNPGALASEEINALFGWGSQFHETHGFYIDGVDEATSRLPDGWCDRAVRRICDVSGRRVTAIPPEPHDLAAAKLHRLDPKDEAFIWEHHRSRPYDRDRLWEAFVACDPDALTRRRAEAFFKTLR